MSHYDYIIIGSGIAGLFTALKSREFGTVLIVTKSGIADSNTQNAQGGIAAPISEDDSPTLYFKDIISAGAGLSNPDAARVLVDEANDRIRDLIDFGVPFDRTDNKIALGREAAHSLPRVLHAGGDATGAFIESALVRRVREKDIDVRENCLATRIEIDRGKLGGVKVLDNKNNSTTEFACRFLILATGGAGQLFKYSTNPLVATGDGIALALDAGIEVTDMEFFQFHPTALCVPGVRSFLISEAVRGEGGILRNIDKRAFMCDYSPEAELAPRDVVARSIVAEMLKTESDHVFLDVTHLPSVRVRERFPTIHKFLSEHGLDMTNDPIPVCPAAHFYMGGVKTSTWGETNIPNIFAAGEAACTGVHGANRLASTSLLAGVVFGNRIVERTRTVGSNVPISVVAKNERYFLEERKAEGKIPALSLANLQSLLWNKAGITRNDEELREAAETLAGWQTNLPPPIDRSSFELKNLVTVGRLMAEAALLREESRGAHFRTDFPETSEAWKRHITFRKK